MDELEGGVEGLVIGLPREYLGEGVAPEVRDAVLKAIRLLEEQGARVQELSLPHSRYALAVYSVVSTAEASSNLGRYDGVRYGYRSQQADDVGTMFRTARQRASVPK